MNGKIIIRWANIICDRNMKPTMLIITDGELDTQIPVQNTKLETVQRAAREVYGVPKRRTFITQVLGDVNEKP